MTYNITLVSDAQDSDLTSLFIMLCSSQVLLNFDQNCVISKVESFALLSLSIPCSALSRWGAVTGRYSADLQVTDEVWREKYLCTHHRKGIERDRIQSQVEEIRLSHSSRTILDRTDH